MKQQGDKQKFEWHFDVGDWVHQKLQPYRQEHIGNRISKIIHLLFWTFQGSTENKDSSL